MGETIKFENWIKCGSTVLDHIDIENNIISNVIFVEMGEAKGHYTKSGLPFYFDGDSLITICDLMNNNEDEITLTKNHGTNIESIIGRVLPKSCRLESGKVIGSIEIYETSFEKEMDNIGQKIIGLLKGSNESLNISLEVEADIEENGNVGLIRPFFVDAVSIVMHGAATNKFILLQKGKLINNTDDYQSEEIEMARKAKIKLQEPEQVVEPEKIEEVVEQIVEEKVVDIVETTVEDIVEAKIEEVAEVTEVSENLQEEEKEEPKTGNLDYFARFDAIDDSLKTICSILSKFQENPEEEKKEETKVDMSSKPVQVLQDIEDSNEVIDDEVTDDDLRKNWRKFWKRPELRKRIQRLK